MIRESFPRRIADVQARLLLVQAASEGKLDGLRCPQCECQTVSVVFTHPSAGEYHTWFVCEKCDFSMRAQNSGKPEHYSKERDRTGKSTRAVMRDHEKVSDANGDSSGKSPSDEAGVGRSA